MLLMFIILLPNTCFDVEKGEDEGGGKDMKNEVKSIKSAKEEGMQCLFSKRQRRKEGGKRR